MATIRKVCRHPSASLLELWYCCGLESRAWAGQGKQDILHVLRNRGKLASNFMHAGYRQLYHDVLSSGQRTFVVTATDPETARLASYGAGLWDAEFTSVCKLAGNMFLCLQV